MWNPFKENTAIGDSHGLPRMTQMEIVCGDCAGDALHPRKTILTSDGSCADCGGRSFVCAVRLFKVLQRHRLSNKSEVRN